MYVGIFNAFGIGESFVATVAKDFEAALHAMDIWDPRRGPRAPAPCDPRPRARPAAQGCTARLASGVALRPRHAAL
eukprot:9082535-Lingulodinium_polyedra.AAC.1